MSIHVHPTHAESRLSNLSIAPPLVCSKRRSRRPLPGAGLVRLRLAMDEAHLLRVLFAGGDGHQQPLLAIAVPHRWPGAREVPQGTWKPWFVGSQGQNIAGKPMETSAFKRF